MPQSTRLNSDLFACGPFRPHGRAELWAEGKVIHLTAAGPFNQEAVVAIGAAWHQLFADLPAQGLFADLVTVTGSLMAGPDVMQAFGQFLRANTAANIAPCAVAWVVPPEVEGALLMTPLFKQVYEAAGRNVAFFDTAHDAQVWIRAQLQQAHLAAQASDLAAQATD
ncbi:MAG: hypothetical protein K2W33_05800 [Burkholderiales bacterium]|nr:hypothetical protein [Burkholderiales bacterium]